MATRFAVAAAAVCILAVFISGCGSCGGSWSTTPSPTPTPATTGALTVTVGYSSGPGETCTGSTIVTVSGGGVTKPAQTLTYGGISSQVDSTHHGCTVSQTYSSLAPGTWTAKATPTGNCSTGLVANSFGKIFIWDGVCS